MSKRILITGASRGIGRAIAEKLAVPDVTLLLHGRDTVALAETCTALQLHTVLVANMAAPLVAWSDDVMAGTPESCSEQPAPPSSGSAPAPASDGQAIAIKDNTFPKETDVSPGTKVTWTNDDDVAHTVTSMHGGPLKSGTLDKGASYSYTFSSPGTYAYYCSVHPDMKGTVTAR